MFIIIFFSTLSSFFLCIVEQDTESCFLPSDWNPHLFMSYKLPWHITLTMEQHKFTEEQNRGMTSELNKWAASLLSSTHPRLVFGFQTISHCVFLFALLIFHRWMWEITSGNRRHFGLIACDWQTECWFPLLSVWIWVSLSRGPYKATLKNQTIRKGEMNNVVLN